MPILPNAKKALRSSQRKAKVNKKLRSRVKTTFDKLKAEPNQENLEECHSAIDKAVKKGIYHKNKGARLKSKAAKIVADTQEK
jgi:small subunit ribosomal protein S20